MMNKHSDITVILTLYKTPKEKLKNLNHYKKYKIIFFDQESDGSFKNIIKYILHTIANSLFFCTIFLVLRFSWPLRFDTCFSCLLDEEIEKKCKFLCFFHDGFFFNPLYPF